MAIKLPESCYPVMLLKINLLLVGTLYLDVYYNTCRFLNGYHNAKLIFGTICQDSWLVWFVFTTLLCFHGSQNVLATEAIGLFEFIKNPVNA